MPRRVRQISFNEAMRRLCGFTPDYNNKHPNVRTFKFQQATNLKKLAGRLKKALADRGIDGKVIYEAGGNNENLPYHRWKHCHVRVLIPHYEERNLLAV